MKVKHASKKEFKELLKRDDIFVQADPHIESFIIIAGLLLIGFGIFNNPLITMVGIPILVFGVWRYRKFLKWYVPYLKRKRRRE